MYLKKAAMMALATSISAVAACGTGKRQQGSFVRPIGGGVLGSRSGSGQVAATIARRALQTTPINQAGT